MPEIRSVIEILEIRRLLAAGGFIDMPTPPPFPIDNFAPVAVVDGRAIFGRAYDLTSFSSDRVDIYDAATGDWSTTQLARPLGLAATTVGHLAIFAGGTTTPIETFGSSLVDIYDTSTGQWSTAALSVGTLRMLGLTSVWTNSG